MSRKRSRHRGGVRVSASPWLSASLVALAVVVAARTEIRAQEPRRARDLGIIIGEWDTGPHDAITDVEGVRVGHATLVIGDSIRTGVTAVLPHEGNLFQDKVRAAIAVGNGFGKLVGLSQVNELGLIETPILLTGTLSVFRVADALVDTLLLVPGNEDVRSINPVVGETNDGWLSDSRARPVGPPHVRAALRAARRGPVEEGSVGAGTGTRALGWKGGIGTASRRLAEASGGHTVGVLVQTNYGGTLTVAGVSAHTLGSGFEEPALPDTAAGGSVMIVLATDAPLDHRDLMRLAYRAFFGIARTGSNAAHDSGDYAIAFTVNRTPPVRLEKQVVTDLFAAAMDATEEAALNSLLAATTTRGFRGRVARAVPVADLVSLIDAAGR